MINRLQLIRNLGQFDSVDAGSNLPLNRVNVVFSENGRGKTTVTAVFRSLASGDPNPISERRRLAAQHPPHVVVDCAGDTSAAVFNNGAWNRTRPEVIVFDDHFIDQNVHSGLNIESQHRQNLHELILGTQAVNINRQLQQLVSSVENHNRELRTKANQIHAADRGPFNIDDFCSLTEIPNIDEAVRDAERAVAAASEQEPIRATTGFGSIHLPTFDIENLNTILQRDLPTLDTATLARVQTHLSGLGQGGEAWVSTGMRLSQNRQDGFCPFCAQDLENSQVIDHYRTFFSNEYTQLKLAVQAGIQTVERTHGGDVPAGFERSFRELVQKRQFWSRFCEVPEITLDTAQIVRAWKTAREAVMAQLAAKQAAPLERLKLSEETRNLIATYETHRTSIIAINEQLRIANTSIDTVKERIATANTATLSADLIRAKAVRSRFTTENVARCGEYLAEKHAKEATEHQRDQVREQLETHRANVFPRYQTAINLYLARLNAEFRLDQVTHANTRGGPVCTYNVLINNNPVAIGGGAVNPGTPSFKSTLSAGDRNTLALAFFFTSLDQEGDLANKVVIIDDPISSMDDHRALATAQEIRRLATRVSQVIVLSHNKPFLCRLWEGLDDTNRAAIELVRGDNGSTFRAWDVSRDSITEHDKRHQALTQYLNNGAGEQREVARSIRPHIEAYLRVARPGAFPPGTLLGPFRNHCRQHLGRGTEVFNQSSLQELEEIIEYANRFHHDTNPAWETETINDGELRGYVERAMRLVR